jgi:phosphoribosyl-ATP pyrophosphohydrolase/phosphoribosyl-AMP cyclohydrolase
MKIDFAKYADALAPAIVQHAVSGEILMLGFMTEEALGKTVENGRVTFYSRSRKQLWTKGETSGNFLSVVAISADCDNDTILVKAIPSGPVCHTGLPTCFGAVEEPPPLAMINELSHLIEERYRERPAGSYVAGLLEDGINRVAQKVGEEAVELVIAAKDEDRNGFVNEAADLLFHYLILLRAKNVPLADVTAELRRRHRDATGDR